MAQLTPELEETSQEDGVLTHTITVDSVSSSRARSKAKRLANVKGFSEISVVGVNESGESSPPGFTNYEVVVTSVR